MPAGGSKRRLVLIATRGGAATHTQFDEGIADYFAAHPYLQPRREAGIEAAPDRLSVVGVRPDGIIAFAPATMIAMRDNAATHGIPVVTITESTQVEPRVSPDNEAIGAMGASYLADLGVQSLAFASRIRVTYAQDRWGGFAGRAGELGKHVEGWEEEYAGQDMEALLRWLRGLARPVGLMAMTDIYAERVMSALIEAGLHVPDDVAVLGVDNDTALCRLSHPPLSSVDENDRRIGYEAAAMLDRLMQGRPLAETIVRVAPLEVVPRASTNVLFQDDHLVAEALRYLRDHANERIGVAEIAEAIAVNRRDLERRFKAAIGQTVHKYLQRLRIEHVKKQLTHTRKTLAQIRRDTPFQSASHLNQVFRRIEGMTPTQYRRRAAGPHGA